MRLTFIDAEKLIGDYMAGARRQGKPDAYANSWI